MLRCLKLIRPNPDLINSIHESKFQTRFTCRTQNLNVQINLVTQTRIDKIVLNMDGQMGQNIDTVH